MSLQRAHTLIERMNADTEFANLILAKQNIEERLTLARIEGFECAIEDIQALETAFSDPLSDAENLPITWQCKGPCHDKCSDYRFHSKN